MRVAILFPITGIAGAPLARAVPADLAVYGVCGDLLSVVVGAPSSLAIRRAAYLLAGLELRRLEALLAITATPFMHTGVVVPRQSRFRNWCRVPYRVPANGLFPDHITGENAGVLNRGQHRSRGYPKSGCWRPRNKVESLPPSASNCSAIHPSGDKLLRCGALRLLRIRRFLLWQLPHLGLRALAMLRGYQQADGLSRRPRLSPHSRRLSHSLPEPRSG